MNWRHGTRLGRVSDAFQHATHRRSHAHVMLIALVPVAWQMLMCIGGCKNSECDEEEQLARAFIDDPAEGSRNVASS